MDLGDAEETVTGTTVFGGETEPRAGAGGKVCKEVEENSEGIVTVVCGGEKLLDDDGDSGRGFGRMMWGGVASLEYSGNPEEEV